MGNLDYLATIVSYYHRTLYISSELSSCSHRALIISHCSVVGIFLYLDWQPGLMLVSHSIFCCINRLCIVVGLYTILDRLWAVRIFRGLLSDSIPIISFPLTLIGKPCIPIQHTNASILAKLDWQNVSCSQRHIQSTLRILVVISRKHRP